MNRCNKRSIFQRWKEETKHPTVHFISWRTCKGWDLEVPYYSSTLWWKRVQTQCYSDKKMPDSALPRKSCGSWTEVWREFFFLTWTSSFIPPAWEARCCPQRQELLVQTQKTDLLYPSPLTRTDCPVCHRQLWFYYLLVSLHETGLCMATYTSLQQWDEQHAHCLPFLYLLFPSEMVPHELRRWLNACSLCLRDKTRRHFY